MQTTKEIKKCAKSKKKKYTLTKEQKEKMLLLCKKCKKREKRKQSIHEIKDILLEILKLLCLFNLLTIMQYCISGNRQMEFILKILSVAKELELGTLLEYIGEARLLNDVYFFNMLIAFSIFGIIYALTNRKRRALCITTTILFAYETLNYIVTAIRGTAISIADIFSVRTALNVVEGMQVHFDTPYIIATGIGIFIFILIRCFYKTETKKQWKTRVASIVLCILLLVGMTNLDRVQSMSIWNINDTYKDYGTNLTVLKLSTNLTVKKPEHYKKTEMETLLNAYTGTNTTYDTDVNIVAIMNESFADYTENPYIAITQDNIPYFHSLQKEENVVTGTMHSDAFGAYTANMEYEFLTQNTIAFLPVGAMPYQQYIHGPITSMVSRMKAMDYTTYGIHTWFKTGYNREKVYTLMGFDNRKFKEDFTDLKENINGYTTDESTYSKIIEIFENKQEAQKVFSFTVTMENHTPYVHTDAQAATYSEKETANVYLQIQNKSDAALEKFIQYLKEYDEKVVVLFFGDHQPNVEMPEIIQDEENKYKVPYLLWANYDIEETSYGDTSANYLQSILMEVANLPKDAYTNYMTALRKEIPVLTAHYYIGNNGIRYALRDENSPYYEKIIEYEKMVYYQMFQNKSE